MKGPVLFAPEQVLDGGRQNIPPEHSHTHTGHALCTMALGQDAGKNTCCCHGCDETLYSHPKPKRHEKKSQRIGRCDEQMSIDIVIPNQNVMREEKSTHRQMR